MLLTIAQIQHELEARFTSLLGEMPELDVYLLKRRFTHCEFEHLEQRLKVQMPTSFAAFLRRHDLDAFTIGPITFGIGGHYLSHLIELNQDPNASPWWNTPNRPEHQVVIATSDPYAIVLDCHDQQLYAISDTPCVDDREPVAADFELFLRGVGTGFLLEPNPEDIAREVRSQHPEFWHQI